MNKAYILLLTGLTLSAISLRGQSDYCTTLDQQGLIFCDDFESSEPLTGRYFEVDDNNGEFGVQPGVGRDGSKGVRGLWQEGEVDAGGLLKSFGRTPSNYIGQHANLPDSNFMEVYWKLDVRHQEGWQGNGPAKLCRALTMANANWATGAMAHLWTGGPNDQYLGMDPASGIDVNGNLVTTTYNDFANMRWLGWKYGTTPMFADQEAGKWFCVEGHIRLNTPGESDGVFEFWINDTLQQGSYNLNWHGDWNADPDHYGINALFINNYWNAGSPVEQERYFDNVVIATQRIGCPEPVTRVESAPNGQEIFRVGPAGFEWDLLPGLSGEVIVSSVLGQVAQVFQVQAAAFRPFAPEMIPGIYYYSVRLSDGQIIPGSALVR